jgi:hypothetical protein
MRAKLIKDHDDYHLVNDEQFVIGTTDESILSCTDKMKLSLKNCQAIELGYDLDELAKEELLKAEKHHKLLSPITYRDGVIKGFRKALEILGDKKFSEEDIKKALEFDKFENEFNNKFYESQESFIQSLQQTEWDVEICNIMDCISGNPCNGTSFECNHCTNVGEPKLDVDGCLILRRI